jgi:4-hydroxybenzoate polyprenyltransferase
MSWAVALKLGRVSNLPTVWTNMVAGIVLAGGTITDPRTVPLVVALSLFYVGGMYLNDAFDAEIDAKERPERPIPSGAVARATVYGLGYGMLAVAMLLLGWIGVEYGAGPWPAASGALLSAAIVAYNWRHKDNPISPIVMGLCRVFVYVTAGVCFAAAISASLAVGAGLMLCYLIGLTYVAKQENIGRVENMWPLLFLAAPIVYGGTRLDRGLTAAAIWVAIVVLVLAALRFVKRRGPGDIPKAVVSLIAGISLLDAMFIAGAGEPRLAGLAVLGFLLTLALQRFVPGT